MSDDEIKQLADECTEQECQFGDLSNVNVFAACLRMGLKVRERLQLEQSK